MTSWLKMVTIFPTTDISTQQDINILLTNTQKNAHYKHPIQKNQKSITNLTLNLTHHLKNKRKKQAMPHQRHGLY